MTRPAPKGITAKYRAWTDAEDVRDGAVHRAARSTRTSQFVSDPWRLYAAASANGPHGDSSPTGNLVAHGDFTRGRIWEVDRRNCRTEQRRLSLRVSLRMRVTEGSTRLSPWPCQVMRSDDLRSQCQAWAQSTRSAHGRVSGLGRHAESMREQRGRLVPSLRRARHHGVRPLARVVRGVPGRRGPTPITASLDRSHQQQRQLRAGELPVGDTKGAAAEPTQQPSGVNRRRREASCSVGGGTGARKACDHQDVRTVAGVPRPPGKLWLVPTAVLDNIARAA